MRLTSIKLAGFKSFVDPTVVMLPSDFTVVLGPNGCGKSNIIDAVRWVMGESSAGRLRGDAMTDVIFSGAAGRKAVAQASVELCFDNSDSVIGGEYAAFNELSVRRTVSRDGSSSYFLNGSRCRRRDVTELFLGTGLGPRSYAIIEQGMISQMIDAKPDELRAYLEEAAGITLYKERRRETRNRIGQTRENLARLEDLRGEVGRQLDHLRVQAEQAGLYRRLKSECEQVQAQVLAAQFREATVAQSVLQDAVRRAQEACDVALNQVEQSNVSERQQRADLSLLQQAHEAAQAALYRTEGERARVEQALAHTRHVMVRRQEERERAREDLDALQVQVQEDRLCAAELQSEVDRLAPQRVAAEADCAQRQARWLVAVQQRQQWQQQWEAAMHVEQQASRGYEREQARATGLAREQEALQLRLVTARTHHGVLLEECEAQSQVLQTVQLHVQQEGQQLALLEGEVQHLQDSVTLAEQRRVDAEEAVQLLKGHRQMCAAELAALQAQQRTGMDQSLHDWLVSQGVSQVRTLAQCLCVEAGWEKAVEVALGPWLSACVVPQGVLAGLEQAWTGEGMCWLVSDACTDEQPPAGSLAVHAEGPAFAMQRLSAIIVCGSGEGRDLMPADAAHVTVGGRLYALYGSACGAADAQAGTLLREKRIALLESDSAELEQSVRAAMGQQVQARENVEQVRDLAQRTAVRCNQLQVQLAVLRTQLHAAQERCTEGVCQQQRSCDEQARLELQYATVTAEADKHLAVLRIVTAALADAVSVREQLSAQREMVADAEAQAGAEMAAAKDVLQALDIAAEKVQTQWMAMTQAVRRSESQLLELQLRLQDGSQEEAAQAEVIAALERERALVAESHAGAVALAQEARGRAQQAEQVLEQILAEQRARTDWLSGQHEHLVQLRLKEQAAGLSATHSQAQAREAGCDLEVALEALPATVDVSSLVKQWRAKESRLSAVGPVNMAAIDEYDKAGERHRWLNEQQVDLSEALATLEAAMSRIDKETRSRFRETFERVNAGLQVLYPQLFGGGQAWLETVGEDLLDAGIVLMARPPGKKVSSLSLLSGGEKAMTAVALVFSIFQLNPAPFCLLDEVDAPLDESNVGRLAAMLRQMSDKVQFLAVSHNKATMEAADQLCGVTMREPGVSRLVSVDLTEATRLAGVV